LPILIIGFFIRDLVEIFLRSPEIIAYATIFFAVILYLSTKVKTRYSQLDSISPIQSLIIGLAQCLALIPGTSRSGVTISAGLALGVESKVASRFSFLLAIPTIGAIACYQIISVDFASFAAEYRSNLTGILISFVVAYLTIDFFIKFIDRIGFMPFIIYRLFLGASILLFLI
jgi:undecaprenyl-diphosphatase